MPAGSPKTTLPALPAATIDFDGVDRLVLEATDEMLADGRAQAATWNASSSQLGTHQAMELIFVVGTYAMLAMACDTWELVPPPGSAKLPNRA